MKNYKQYSTQLSSFLESKSKHIEANGGVISEAHKTRFKNELSELPYYVECYVNRNKPPYKSIVYLDHVIDAMEVIFNKNGEVINEIYELLNQLKY